MSFARSPLRGDPASLSKPTIITARIHSEVAPSSLIPLPRKHNRTESEHGDVSDDILHSGASFAKPARKEEDDDKCVENGETRQLKNVPQPFQSLVLHQEEGSKWINLLSDNNCKFMCFTQQLSFIDVEGSGCSGLIGLDIGDGLRCAKLIYYSPYSSTKVLDLPGIPSAVCCYYCDTRVTKLPVLAISVGAVILLYKNLKAYGQWKAPIVPASEVEQYIWREARAAKEVDFEMLVEMLQGQVKEVGINNVSSLTAAFITLQSIEERIEFFENSRSTPLGSSDTIVCMTPCLKESNVTESPSVLFVGCESQKLYVLDGATQRVMLEKSLPAVPVFIYVQGIFEIDYRVVLSGRDGCVYVFKNNMDAMSCINAYCPIMGISRSMKDTVVGCMDNSFRAYRKDKLQWKINLDSNITAMCTLVYEPTGMQAVLVATADKCVKVFRDKFLVDSFRTAEVVIAMTYGTFCREEGCLALIFRSGSLYIKCLRRTARFDEHDVPFSRQQKMLSKDIHQFSMPPANPLVKDMQKREIESYMDMYQSYLYGLCNMKLELQKFYFQAYSKRLLPVVSSLGLDITTELIGGGPNFVLNILISNTLSSGGMEAVCNFQAVLEPDCEGVVSVEQHFWEIPVIVPQETVKVACRLRVVKFGLSSLVTLHLLKGDETIPVVSRPIELPACEEDLLDGI